MAVSFRLDDRMIDFRVVLGFVTAHTCVLLFAEATQAYSAVKRIAAFLTREVRTGEYGLLTPAEERSIGTAPLVLKNAFFYIDDIARPAAFRSTDTIRVGKGHVMAVCGPVGGEICAVLLAYVSLKTN